MVSEVTEDGKVYGCSVKDGPALEKLMDNLREEFRTNPPLAGAYQPRKIEMCAAKFVDNQWYRAKVGLDNVICCTCKLQVFIRIWMIYR